MKPIDRSKLKTVSAQKRHSKVNTDDFAKPVPADASAADLLASFPHILKAGDLRELAAVTAEAHRNGRGIVWGMGGHVIKVGLAPLLADLMERGLVTSLLLNGSAAIHDYEIALMGRTSEDVGPGVATGEFGMAEETGSFFAAAVERGRDIGMGEALKQAFVEAGPAAPRSVGHRRGREVRHSDHRARRDRHRHRAHAPEGGRRGVRRGVASGFFAARRDLREARRRRLSELGLGRDRAGGVREGGHAAEQSARRAHRRHHRQLRHAAPTTGRA